MDLDFIQAGACTGTRSASVLSFDFPAALTSADFHPRISAKGPSKATLAKQSQKRSVAALTPPHYLLDFR